MKLGASPSLASGLLSGVRVAIEKLTHIVDRDMGIESRRCVDVRMTKQALHRLEVSSVAQEARRPGVPRVVEAQIKIELTLHIAAPLRLHVLVGDRIALLALPAVAGALGDVAEHPIVMMAAAAREDRLHFSRQRNRVVAAALLNHRDRAGFPIDLIPAQEAFGKAKAARQGKAPEIAIALAQLLTDRRFLIAGLDLPHEFAALFKAMGCPVRLADNGDLPLAAGVGEDLTRYVDRRAVDGRRRQQLDASALTTENIVATVVAGVGIGIGILGIWKYLKELKSPTTANGDRIIPGLSIADMQPIRELAAAQGRSADAAESIAAALEKMLLLSQERAEDAEIGRRAEILSQEILKQLPTSQPRAARRRS